MLWASFYWFKNGISYTIELEEAVSLALIHNRQLFALKRT